MIVYGISRGEDLGKDLFKGDLEECRTYCEELTSKGWDSVNICKDNGEIVERIVKDGFRL